MDRLTLFLIAAALGAFAVRWWFGRPRWRVKVANGHTSRRVSYFEARTIRRMWPKHLAEIVRDGR